MKEKSKKGTMMELKAIIKFIDVKSESYRIKDKSKINRILTKNQKDFKKTSGLNISLEMMR